MTIAACYLSPEGVVFGSDSTTTVFVRQHGGAPGENHYFDFGQKIFEIGKESTLGIVTWGLGGFPDTSYRTLFAEFADELKGIPPASVEDAARKWATKFWSVYDAKLRPFLDALKKGRATMKRKQSIDTFISNMTVGFCLGGTAESARQPTAYEMEFSLLSGGAPSPEPLESGQTIFRGMPNLVNRMIHGIDSALIDRILSSTHWKGTDKDLFEVIRQSVLGQPARMPLREAIDWVYSCIKSTIKAMKFSHLAPMCGGPVEIAIVTSDRPFRWVKHKKMDAAIMEAHEETL